MHRSKVQISLANGPQFCYAILHMSPLPLFRLLAAVAIGTLFAAPYNAHAQRVVTSESKSLHEWATLTGTGTEVLPQPILHPYPILFQANATPIAIGPITPPIFFPFNTGSVDLVALLRSGSTTGSIDVSVTGYAAGTYTVSAVTESSSSTVVLGNLTVISGSLPIWTGSNPIIPLGSTIANGIANGADGVLSAKPPSASYVVAPWFFSSGYAKFGGKNAPFPAGFSPFDVATVSVTDSNSNIVSTATVTPVPDGFYNAVSPLVAGTSAPGATGFAVIRANTPPVFLPIAQVAANAKAAILGGPVPVTPPIAIFSLKTGELVIRAHGLPASTTLTYAADGTDLGTATTDAAGNLNVFAAQGPRRKLPATLDLYSVKAVTVHDGAGNVYVSASF